MFPLLKIIEIKDSYLNWHSVQESAGAVIGSTLSYLNIVEFQFAKGPHGSALFSVTRISTKSVHFSNYNTKIKTSGVRSAELLPLGQVHALGWSHSNSTCEWIWNNNILHNKYQFRLLLVKPDMWIELDIVLCVKRLFTQERSCGHAVYVVWHESFTYL